MYDKKQKELILIKIKVKESHRLSSLQAVVMCLMQHAREPLHVGMHVMYPPTLACGQPIQLKEDECEILPRSVYTLSFIKTFTLPLCGKFSVTGSLANSCWIGSGSQKQCIPCDWAALFRVRAANPQFTPDVCVLCLHSGLAAELIGFSSS